MALDKTRRQDACSLLILELVVIEDRIRQMAVLAQQTGFTSINGRLKALRKQVAGIQAGIQNKIGAR